MSLKSAPRPALPAAPRGGMSKAAEPHLLMRVLLGTTLALSAALVQAAPAGTVYTANERGASISRIDLASGTVSTFKVAIAPHNVQVSPDGRWLLATGMLRGAGHEGHDTGAAGGRLLVFRIDDLDRPAQSLAAGDHPAHVVTDLDGKRAFVADSGAGVVRVFDLQAGKETGRITTGRYPHGLRLSPDGSTLYVAAMKSDVVSVIDVASLEEKARIKVGKAPVQVGFAADGKLAFVALSGENQLGFIDTARQTLIGKVPVGRTPIQMFATPDGRQVYVANQGSAAAPDDRVSVIDPATRKVLATITTGKGAHGVAMSGDGAYAFVTNIEDATVSVIDTTTRRVVASYRVGAGPNGVSFRAP
ncbi:MAG TPA: cytochrome D1 domain-containing protein [Rubrivivax sp.]|nr:cytochrome D1 domain-containing protein [Rubrivivax sp.]